MVDREAVSGIGALLVMIPGMVKSPRYIPGRRSRCYRKGSKADRVRGQGIGSRVPRGSCDLFRRLFYVAGIVPANGGAKQLSQRGNAELFFRSGAVSLDGFETQIQIAGDF